ncbi:unnamed protein product [Amoebophrya sp. A25]|nr:unnamed protein product [Amoebophrya sp. A25]|eukprot:GSA25T00016818001.1
MLSLSRAWRSLAALYFCFGCAAGHASSKLVSAASLGSGSLQPSLGLRSEQLGDEEEGVSSGNAIHYDGSTSGSASAAANALVKASAATSTPHGGDGERKRKLFQIIGDTNIIVGGGSGGLVGSLRGLDNDGTKSPQSLVADQLSSLSLGTGTTTSSPPTFLGTGTTPRLQTTGRTYSGAPNGGETTGETTDAYLLTLTRLSRSAFAAIQSPEEAGSSTQTFSPAPSSAPGVGLSPGVGSGSGSFPVTGSKIIHQTDLVKELQQDKIKLMAEAITLSHRLKHQEQTINTLRTEKEKAAKGERDALALVVEASGAPASGRGVNIWEVEVDEDVLLGRPKINYDNIKKKTRWIPLDALAAKMLDTYYDRYLAEKNDKANFAPSSSLSGFFCEELDGKGLSTRKLASSQVTVKTARSEELLIDFEKMQQTHAATNRQRAIRVRVPVPKHWKRQDLAHGNRYSTDLQVILQPVEGFFSSDFPQPDKRHRWALFQLHNNATAMLSRPPGGKSTAHFSEKNEKSIATFMQKLKQTHCGGGCPIGPDGRKKVAVWQVENWVLWNRYRQARADLRAMYQTKSQDQDSRRDRVSNGPDVDQGVNSPTRNKGKKFIADIYPGINPGILEAVKMLLDNKEPQLWDDVNEVYLLHGTRVATAEAIATFGFDPRLSRDSNCLYGQGTYFASNFCKSLQYAGDLPRVPGEEKKNHVLIISRVLIGDPYVTPKVCCEMKRPPLNVNRCPHQRSQHPGRQSRPPLTRPHDSIMARPGKIESSATIPPIPHPSPNGEQIHQEFVIFDQYAAYPEFIVRW